MEWTIKRQRGWAQWSAELTAPGIKVEINGSFKAGKPSYKWIEINGVRQGDRVAMSALAKAGVDPGVMQLLFTRLVEMIKSPFKGGIKTHVVFEPEVVEMIHKAWPEKTRSAEINQIIREYLEGQ